ncbi:hypothetical protein CBR_g48667 [Chara braunii]|uniref:Myb/SANT-like DNA-binding domain-containing protein n=1 Tax=Chara braunii TaxID=69332 RepID=A0A388K4H9_CHABU|nr:hypothetical protein CBR_g48667 [Chara braunii]|eukprot:GBG64919.1 hypothetical protein CBR_g48667 [Chara braunii]
MAGSNDRLGLSNIEDWGLTPSSQGHDADCMQIPYSQIDAAFGGRRVTTVDGDEDQLRESLRLRAMANDGHHGLCGDFAAGLSLSPTPLSFPSQFSMRPSAETMPGTPQGRRTAFDTPVTPLHITASAPSAMESPSVGCGSTPVSAHSSLPGGSAAMGDRGGPASPLTVRSERLSNHVNEVNGQVSGGGAACPQRRTILQQIIHDIEFGDVDPTANNRPRSLQQQFNGAWTQTPMRDGCEGGGLGGGLQGCANEAGIRTTREGSRSSLSNASAGASGPSGDKVVLQEGEVSGAPADKGKKKKASNRWAEKETTVFLRVVYEVKMGMGENSEAMGIAPLKVRLWADVSARMKQAHYVREDDECMNRYHFVRNNYRLVKDHNRCPGSHKYWTMDQATRKANGLDFLMRREWYNILHMHEGDKDTINPNSLTDPGAEDHNRANSEDSDVDEGDDPAADDEAGDVGSGGGDGEGGMDGWGGGGGSDGA